MYLKLSIFLLLFCSSFVPCKAENEPKVQFIRLSQKSLENHVCKDYVEFLEPLKMHPIILIRLENFPLDCKLSLNIKRPLINWEKKLYDFLVADFIDSHIFLPTAYFFPGERVEMTIKAENEEIIYATTLIPNAIRGKNKNGKVIFTAELKFWNNGKPTYTLDLSEFSNETVMFKSVSGKEVIEHPMACREGCCAAVQPAVKGRKGGMGRVTITRKNGETASVNLPWGEQFLEYLNKQELVFDPED